MANLRKPGHHDQAGFDADRNLQVLPRGSRTVFYLVAGDGLEVKTDDDSIAVATTGAADDKRAHGDDALSGWEKGQVIRVVTLAGKSAGSTQLHARGSAGGDMIAPLTVRVTGNVDARQVGKAKGEVTPELRTELQGLGLRQAVLRIAEDQMNSAVSQANGFGVYMDKGLDWCGGFAYWCWQQACAIKGVANPFGGEQSVLWSPQRAIHWAMKDSTPGQLLRYGGQSPMDGKGKQEYREIGWNGFDLKPADIVLVRHINAGGWKHVCMVESVDGRSVITQNGNQGLPKSIKLVRRSLDDRLSDRSFALVFIAVKGV